MKKKSKTLLVDGDMVVFQAAATSEVEVRWTDDVHTLHSKFDDAVDLFDNWRNKMNDVFESDNFIFAFSDKSNFRKEVDETYKSNRKKSRKPLCYSALKDYVCAKYRAHIWPTLEADDILGILATSDEHKDCVVISDDKDLLSIPAMVYRLDTLHNIDRTTADYNFFVQCLVGDATDGYKGCPGIGAKRAEAIFEGGADWSKIVAAYDKAGLDESAALIQARLARILRSEDYDIKNKKVKLWKPKKTKSSR